MTVGRRPPRREVVVDEAARQEGRGVRRAGGGRGAAGSSGRTEVVVTVVAVAMSLYHLYAAYAIIPAHILRATHLGFVLFLLFLLFPAAKRYRDRIRWSTSCCRCSGVATIAYLLLDFDEFIERAVTPTRLDLFFGVALILLVLEGVRRTSGAILAGVVAAFIAYAFAGPYLPAPWTHRGYDVERLVGQLYMTLEGIFGTPIDVVRDLHHPLHHLRRGPAPLRRGRVLHRLLARGDGRQARRRGPDHRALLVPARRAVRERRRDHRHDRLGRVADAREGRATARRRGRAPRRGRPRRDHLAAGARRGRLPHRRVPEHLVPRRHLHGDDPDVPLLPRRSSSWWSSTHASSACTRSTCGRARALAMIRERGFHFTSLFAIVVFMVSGFSPIISVFWAILLAAALSFLRRDTALSFLPTRARRCTARGW